MRKTRLNCLYELAQKDERVVFIGSDLGHGVMDDMKKTLPDRFFMEGVSEQHIVGMAAGLAMEGFIPKADSLSACHPLLSFPLRYKLSNTELYEFGFICSISVRI